MSPESTTSASRDGCLRIQSCSRSCGGSFEPVRPLNLQRRGSLKRLPWLLGDDADKILADDDFDDARQAANGAFVHVDDCRAHRRRSNDLTVQHSRNADVVDELESPGCQRGHVHAGNGLSEHRPFACRFPLRGSTERQRKRSSSNELTVRYALRLIVFDHDRAAARRQTIDGHVESSRRQSEQRLSRGCRREREVLLVEVRRRRLAARRRPLIGRRTRCRIGRCGRARSASTALRRRVASARSACLDRARICRCRPVIVLSALTAIHESSCRGSMWEARVPNCPWPPALSVVEGSASGSRARDTAEAHHQRAGGTDEIASRELLGHARFSSA